jgi:RNAse (barnase) inhibitor barstar
MKSLSELVHEHKHGGVFHVVALPPIKELEKQAKQLRLAFFHLEGRKIERKEQFLNHAALAMHFPEHFGNNWDAFEDCITDFSWLEEEVDGYVIVFDHVDAFVEHSESQIETVIELLQDAVQFWQEQGMKMVVLVQGKPISHVKLTEIR